MITTIDALIREYTPLLQVNPDDTLHDQAGLAAAIANKQLLECLEALTAMCGNPPTLTDNFKTFCRERNDKIHATQLDFDAATDSFTNELIWRAADIILGEQSFAERFAILKPNVQYEWVPEISWPESMPARDRRPQNGNITLKKILLTDDKSTLNDTSPLDDFKRIIIHDNAILNLDNVQYFSLEQHASLYNQLHEHTPKVLAALTKHNHALSKLYSDVTFLQETAPPLKALIDVFLPKLRLMGEKANAVDAEGRITEENSRIVFQFVDDIEALPTEAKNDLYPCKSTKSIGFSDDSSFGALIKHLKKCECTDTAADWLQDIRDNAANTKFMNQRINLRADEKDRLKTDYAGLTREGISLEGSRKTTALPRTEKQFFYETIQLFNLDDLATILRSFPAEDHAELILQAGIDLTPYSVEALSDVAATLDSAAQDTFASILEKQAIWTALKNTQDPQAFESKLTELDPESRAFICRLSLKSGYWHTHLNSQEDQQRCAMILRQLPADNQAQAWRLLDSKRDTLLYSAICLKALIIINLLFEPLTDEQKVIALKHPETSSKSILTRALITVGHQNNLVHQASPPAIKVAMRLLEIALSLPSTLVYEAIATPAHPQGISLMDYIFQYDVNFLNLIMPPLTEAELLRYRDGNGNSLFHLSANDGDLWRYLELFNAPAFIALAKSTNTAGETVLHRLTLTKRLENLRAAFALYETEEALLEALSCADNKGLTVFDRLAQADNTVESDDDVSAYSRYTAIEYREHYSNLIAIAKQFKNQEHLLHYQRQIIAAAHRADHFELIESLLDNNDFPDPEYRLLDTFFSLAPEAAGKHCADLKAALLEPYIRHCYQQGNAAFVEKIIEAYLSQHNQFSLEWHSERRAVFLMLYHTLQENEPLYLKTRLSNDIIAWAALAQHDDDAGKLALKLLPVHTASTSVQHAYTQGRFPLHQYAHEEKFSTVIQLIDSPRIRVLSKQTDNEGKTVLDIAIEETIAIDILAALGLYPVSECCTVLTTPRLVKLMRNTIPEAQLLPDFLKRGKDVKEYPALCLDVFFKVLSGNAETQDQYKTPATVAALLNQDALREALNHQKEGATFLEIMLRFTPAFILFWEALSSEQKILVLSHPIKKGGPLLIQKLIKERHLTTAMPSSDTNLTQFLLEALTSIPTDVLSKILVTPQSENTIPLTELIAETSFTYPHAFETHCRKNLSAEVLQPYLINHYRASATEDREQSQLMRFFFAREEIKTNNLLRRNQQGQTLLHVALRENRALAEGIVKWINDSALYQRIFTTHDVNGALPLTEKILSGSPCPYLSDLLNTLVRQAVLPIILKSNPQLGLSMLFYAIRSHNVYLANAVFAALPNNEGNALCQRHQGLIANTLADNIDALAKADCVSEMLALFKDRLHTDRQAKLTEKAITLIHTEQSERYSHIPNLFDMLPSDKCRDTFKNKHDLQTALKQAGEYSLLVAARLFDRYKILRETETDRTFHWYTPRLFNKAHKVQVAEKLASQARGKGIKLTFWEKQTARQGVLGNIYQCYKASLKG